MQHIKAIPALGNNTIGVGDFTRHTKNRGPIVPRQRAHTNDNHRPFGFFQFGGKFVRSVGDLVQNRRIIAKTFSVIGQVSLRANNGDRHPA